MGDHACTYLAALLLRRAGVARVRHVTIPTDVSPNRAVLVNPAVFELDKCLAGWRKAAALAPVSRMRFLGDDPATHSEHAAVEPLAYVARLADLSAALRAVAIKAGVSCTSAKSLKVCRPDPNGVDVVIDGVPVRTRAIIVGGELPEADKRALGIALDWEAGVQRRVCYVELPRRERRDPAGAAVSMSLDLKGSLQWAWMLATPDAQHLIVEQPHAPGERSTAPSVKEWAGVLSAHGAMKSDELHGAPVRTMLTPVAGALSRDSVADRTLLIGPAGGFYSACVEDVYPNCWSAVHAVEVLKNALAQPLLQDALDGYRSCWRTSLGLYLQGPQQNLRFLLPMIYRNQAMTARLAEAILAGRNVIR